VKLKGKCSEKRKPREFLRVIYIKLDVGHILSRREMKEKITTET